MDLGSRAGPGPAKCRSIKPPELQLGDGNLHDGGSALVPPVMLAKEQLASSLPARSTVAKGRCSFQRLMRPLTRTLFFVLEGNSSSPL
jgi:hypothetical protein